MRLPLATCLFLSLAHVAVGETIYVNNTSGHDTNSGLTDSYQGEGAGPLRSIGAALKRARRGDRISIARTTRPYHECLTLQGPRNSGWSGKPFVIQGNGAILDGSAPVPPDAWEHLTGDVYRFRPASLGHQVLLWDGKPATQMPRLAAGLCSFLKPGEWCFCGGAMQFATKKDQLPAALNLRYGALRVGVTLYDVQHVVIRDLTVRGFQLDGINAHDNAMDCTLSKLACQSNGRSGVSVGGASRVDVVECGLRQNGHAQLRTEGWSTTRLTSTELESVDRPVPLWIRQPQADQGGGRLLIDGQLQVDLEWYPVGRPGASGDPFVDDG